MNHFTKLMLGENAIHVPMNVIVQNMGKKVSAIVGQIPGQEIRFGGTMAHQLVLCDMFIRPHIVLDSDKFMGHGIAALATINWRDWADEKVIMNPANVDFRKRLGLG